MPDWSMALGSVWIGTASLGTLGMGLWLLSDAVRFRWLAFRVAGTVVRVHSLVEEVTRSNESGS